MLSEAFTRLTIVGLVVSAFAIIGGLFKPTSFAGLFGAAPSVALATLALAISKDGVLVSQLLARFRTSALTATLSAEPATVG